jgi:DnaJ-class molecular chaperone
MRDDDDEDFNIGRFIDQLEETDEEVFDTLELCDFCEGRGFTDDEETCPVCTGHGKIILEDDY